MMKNLVERWKATFENDSKRKLNNLLTAISITEKLKEIFSEKEIKYDYFPDSEILSIMILRPGKFMVKNVAFSVSRFSQRKIVDRRVLRDKKTNKIIEKTIVFDGNLNCFIKSLGQR